MDCLAVRETEPEGVGCQLIGGNHHMAFSAQFLDELRARVGLADIISKRVKLTRRGREHLGLCLFHKEKTPSFTVNEEKGFYHCFGCQAHGSVIDFVMEGDLDRATALDEIRLDLVNLAQARDGIFDLDREVVLDFLGRSPRECQPDDRPIG